VRKWRVCLKIFNWRPAPCVLTYAKPARDWLIDRSIDSWLIDWLIQSVSQSVSQLLIPSPI
jgi:hypothetical protein